MLRIHGVIINGVDDLPKPLEPIYVSRRAATTGNAESGFGPFFGKKRRTASTGPLVNTFVGF